MYYKVLKNIQIIRKLKDLRAIYDDAYYKKAVSRFEDFLIIPRLCTCNAQNT